MNSIEVVYFPKLCPHCKKPLISDSNLVGTWLACGREACPFRKTHNRVYTYAVSPAALRELS